MKHPLDPRGWSTRRRLITGAVAAWGALCGVAFWNAFDNSDVGAVANSATTAGKNPSKLSFKVLDRRVMQGVKIDGLAIEELSGLAWDEDDKLLYAVSDKGRLFQFEMPTDGKLDKLKPTAATQLRGLDNTRFARRNANAEGLDGINTRNGIKGDSELLMVLEANASMGRFGTNGRLRQAIPVPEPLRDPARYVAPERGLESVAMHLKFGVLTAPERPLPGGRNSGIHAIYAGDGRTFLIGKDVAGEADIKAIEVLPDGRVLTLERLRSADWKNYRMFVRVTAIDNCKEGAVCPSIAMEIKPTEEPDANFEGLTRIGNDTFLTVSDDLINNERRTVFVLFQLKAKS